MRSEGEESNEGAASVQESVFLFSSSWLRSLSGERGEKRSPLRGRRERMGEEGKMEGRRKDCGACGSVFT